MYLFTIMAKPSPDNEDVDERVGGAYVSAWIDFPDQDAAEAIAQYYIRHDDWIPGLTTESNWVDETDYTEEDEGWEFFQEARQDGASLVFHMWDKNAEDSDTDFEIN